MPIFHDAGRLAVLAALAPAPSSAAVPGTFAETSAEPARHDITGCAGHAMPRMAAT